MLPWFWLLAASQTPQQAQLIEVITDPGADNPQDVRKGAGSLQQLVLAVLLSGVMMSQSSSQGLV